MTTGTICVFVTHILAITISRSLFLESCSAPLTGVTVRWYCHVDYHAKFLVLAFDSYFRLVGLDGYIRMNLHIPDNCKFFIFCKCIIILVDIIEWIFFIGVPYQRLVWTTMCRKPLLSSASRNMSIDFYPVASGKLCRYSLSVGLNYALFYAI